MPVLQNGRRERFARLVAAGATLEAAYRTAGYRACGADSRQRTLGRRLLAEPMVRERVVELAETWGLPTDRFAWGGDPRRGWVLARLVETAERALQAVPVTDRKGVPKGAYAYQGTVALKALELLGRELGMFANRKQPPEGGAEGLSDEDLERRAVQLAEALGLGRADGDA